MTARPGVAHHKTLSTAWMERAACQGKAELFDSEDEFQQRAAVRLCWNECPVRTDCLNHALARPESFDVWGGYTPAQRDRMRNTKWVKRFCDICGGSVHGRGAWRFCSPECRRAHRAEVERARWQRIKAPVR